MLALWGCPIGEMVDLEKLSEKCLERNRWFFFVTSTPANAPGEFGLGFSVRNLSLIILGR